MHKYSRRFTFLLILFCLGVVAYGSRKQLYAILVRTEATYTRQFDDSTGQKSVWRHSQLDSVLNTLHAVHFSNLPKEYIEHTGSMEAKENLQWREFYQVRGANIYQYVVGHFRVADMMSKDTFYHENISNLPEGCDQYWLTDRKLLHHFLDLLLWMEKKGYNDSAITIKNGHRNPHYNKAVGGVPRSYHMQGMAIDLKVGDIDRNGIADGRDKQILLDVLEKDIIQDAGGLGKYPGSEIIHFDTRGYRARWDKQ
jgi:uncharacterized protein YcbK (DUF882 family)